VVLPTLFLSLWRAGELETAAVAALINTIIVVVVIAIVQRVARTSLHTAVA
jgi:ABC-type Fe3+ transport system permease subunit